MDIEREDQLAGFIVRRLEADDDGEWLRMRLELWPAESVDDLQQEMNAIRGDPTNQVFIAARIDSSICGFLEAGQRKYAEGCETSPVGYIEGWYVDEEMRGSGVGRALVRAAENWAREVGLREMASDCLVENTTSLIAHLACGYDEVERLIHFRKII